MLEPLDGKRPGQLVNLDEPVNDRDVLEVMVKLPPRKIDDEPLPPLRRMILNEVMDGEGDEGLGPVTREPTDVTIR